MTGDMDNLTESDMTMMQEADLIPSEIFELYYKNRSVSERTFYILIAAYSILICVGVCGNMLVVLVVIRKPAMRTARNLFILNLAISDLLLCIVTMPLTLMEILTRYWPLGESDFACKMIGASQAISIFVSTFSITAIALDRYQLIVNPTRDSLQRVGAVFSLAIIWISSFLLAGPIYIFKRLDFPSNTTQIREHLQMDGMIAFCLEDWPIAHGRGLYSGVCLLLQYVVPICTVSIAYSQICRKLQYRQVAARSSTSRRRSRDDRRRRTNSLLVAIAVVYCVSWLPLNVFNIIQDLQNLFGEDHETMIIVYAVCHMFGMSSAVSNPLLYGWLNDNFRKEFKEILSVLWPFPERSRPAWLMPARSSTARPKSNKSTSGEKIGVRAKGASDCEDNSIYIDELKCQRDELKRREITRNNETMTTSLDNGDGDLAQTIIASDLSINPDAEASGSLQPTPS